MNGAPCRNTHGAFFIYNVSGRNPIKDIPAADVVTWDVSRLLCLDALYVGTVAGVDTHFVAYVAEEGYAMPGSV